MALIPVADVAGILAVTFTGAASAPEVQAPATQRPAEPNPGPSAVPEPGPAPAADPGETRPTPAPTQPPTLPPSGTAPAPADPSTQAPVVPAPAASSTPMPTAADSERPLDGVGEGGGEGDEPGGDDDRLLRPHTNRAFFSMAVGGSTSLSPYAAYIGGGMDFQWELAIGAHARRRPTFGGAFVVQNRIGLLNELTFAGRVMWDVPLSKAFAIYSSTSLDLGFNFAIGYGGYLYGFSYPSALFGVNWGIKAVLGERFQLMLRPVSPMITAPSPFARFYVKLRWNVMGGVGVVW